MNRSELEAAKIASLEAAKSIAAKAEAEGREFTDAERAEVKAKIDEAKAFDARLREAEGDDALRKAIGDLTGSIAVGMDAPRGTAKSLGARFTEDPAFKAWHRTVAPNGTIPDSAKGLNSPAVAFGMKELVTGAGDTSGGALVTAQQTGIMDPGTLQRPLTARALVTNGQTNSDSVEFVRVTGFTNNAAPTPEATSAAAGAAVAAGGFKPESGVALERVTASVKTIAHWMPATKRALSDAAQIRTLIDNFLRYGLEEELEDQIVNGNGTGENFRGILNTSGIQAQAWDTDLLVTTRRARTLVRTVGRANPSAFLLNPADNERIDLSRDGNGNFFFGGPASMGVQTLWGLPRVESEAVPVGVGIVGDFRQAILWDREQAAIQVSDSHADFFVRNLVAILAEMRAAFGVVRPSAFVSIDLTAGP